MSLAIFDDDVWQMSRGERAAVEGVLAQLQPSLALEIGSAEGACLSRIAAHAAEVHSFDLTPPTLPVADNVVLHRVTPTNCCRAFSPSSPTRGARWTS